ncbi:Dioxygenase [Colletotrichum orbiculare MAFF 240422]|uniref:Dioxygenase n=1 Tax=Colletotrichum orbiculare (strain 104-T / ATCC 96160 / CBS 514.97 / LARS 414 / MAFF 240422) TaxID=1213857 RepID=N4VYY3_COLOR|nr:Dioxygenase [Colletotrichum orbiculare MAFF 240422]
MSMPAVTKYLGSGLDFSHISYGSKASVFSAQSKVAREILVEKLQSFREINGLAKITFSEGSSSEPPIWIDARSSPVKLHDSAPAGDEPLFELAWGPERFEDLYNGREDAQALVFVMASKGRSKGDFSQAIRFADLITPDPTDAPQTKDELDPEELPKPTEDIDRVKSDLRKWGYGLLKNALSPEQVAILKKAAQEQASGERKAGVATFDGGPKKPNQRIWNILNKGAEFVDLMNHPLIDEIVPWYLGCDNPLLWSYNVNIARPGSQPQVLHWDQGVMGHGRTKPVALNVSWLLCDFTERNGGTRIFPGSHDKNVRPRNVFSSTGSVACEAPAGTALIFEGRLWHGTGRNAEPAGERPCVLSLFCHPAVRPKENAFLGLGWATESELPERQKSLAGFRTTFAGVGGALGEAREGVVVRRPRGHEFDPVGRLRAPHDDAEVARFLLDDDHANNEWSKVREAGGLDASALVK